MMGIRSIFSASATKMWEIPLIGRCGCLLGAGIQRLDSTVLPPTQQSSRQMRGSSRSLLMAIYFISLDRRTRVWSVPTSKCLTHHANNAKCFVSPLGSADLDPRRGPIRPLVSFYLARDMRKRGLCCWCPSVRLSHSCIVSRRLKISSNFFRGPVTTSF